MEINYKDLGLTVDKSRSTFDFNGIEIEISNYLPIQDKYDLIMITLQKSYEDFYYNDIKLDLFFKLNLLYAYTNIIFSKEDREDEAKLYNEVVSSGLMDTFLNNFNETEYQSLRALLTSLVKSCSEAKRSIVSLARDAIENLPGNMQKAVESLREINPDQVKQLMEITKNFQN